MAFVGSIRFFCGVHEPDGYTFCDGKLLSTTEFDVLFYLIGTTYGGDGKSTFAVPDLRGRVVIGAGQGTGLTDRRVSTTGGEDAVACTSLNTPNHDHPFRVSQLPPDDFAAATLSAALIYDAQAAPAPWAALQGGSLAAAPAAQAQPHENRQPYLNVNFIIALKGNFPS
ncbi:MAG: tail fiber protein [Pseudomonadota bacterium]